MVSIMATVENIEKHGNKYSYDLVQAKSGQVVQVVYKTKRELCDEETKTEN